MPLSNIRTTFQYHQIAATHVHLHPASEGIWPRLELSFQLRWGIPRREFHLLTSDCTDIFVWYHSVWLQPSAMMQHQRVVSLHLYGLLTFGSLHLSLSSPSLSPLSKYLEHFAPPTSSSFSGWPHCPSLLLFFIPPSLAIHKKEINIIPSVIHRESHWDFPLFLPPNF